MPLVLLFVFWYCHKRGKETRLEKDRLLSEEESREVYDEQIHADELADTHRSQQPASETQSATTQPDRSQPASEPQSATTQPDPEMEDIEKYLDAAAVKTEAELKQGR